MQGPQKAHHKGTISFCFAKKLTKYYWKMVLNIFYVLFWPLKNWLLILKWIDAEIKSDTFFQQC